MRGWSANPVSNGIGPLLPGSDADSLFDRHHEYLAVANLVCAGGVLNRLHGAFDERIIEHDLDFELGQEVDHVLCSTIDLGMSLLPPEALYLSNGHAGDADFVERVFHLVELKGLYDCFDLFHGFTISDRVRCGLGLCTFAQCD